MQKNSREQKKTSHPSSAYFCTRLFSKEITALTTGTPTSLSPDGRHHLTIAILMLLRLTRSTSLISMQILQIGFFDANHAMGL
jgi:hypothetical protein